MKPQMETLPDETDLNYMRRALRAAARCSPLAAPNPRVGCVIVKGGVILGEGCTQKPGSNHAEIQALADAKNKGHDVRGATAYVTLEPCSHFGRTPPCADALINAGIARVVASLKDPNPLVAGQGYARLQAAGIDVVDGILADDAREMNLGFLSRVERGRPWIRMKVAASLDGKTALHNGQSQWITSEAARNDGHAWRARACAVLTGIGTVQADDPQLTVRAIEVERQPRRIVVDSGLAISPAARVLADGGTWIFTASADSRKKEQLQQGGAEVIVMPDAHGKVDLAALMRELGRREINEVHIEAGAVLNGALLRAGLVDELLLFLAPSLLGEARGMFDLPAIERLDEKFKLRFHEVVQIGPDLRILARFS
jgi:diaminohydroxyphosphoribosylaminopyrimidine deaminase/5-amino-6-(5-phosphoribosylamino)uracil reductase